MRHINGVYTQRFNATYGFDGQLFRGRYKAIVVGEDRYLLQLVRYIHKNPMRAGMVETARQYAWSSHRGYLSEAKKWDWLHKDLILSMIAKNQKQWIYQYRAFMAEDESESFLQTINLKKLPSVLGDNQFVDMIKERFFEGKRHIEVPESKGLAPDADQIIASICNHYNIDRAELFRTKRGVLNEARGMALYLVRYLRGASLTSIGKEFEINSYSTVSSIIERFKAQIQADRKLSRKVERVRNSLLMRQGQT
jgi:putative transposase